MSSDERRAASPGEDLAAGPVAGSSSSQAAGEDPRPAPPAAEAGGAAREGTPSAAGAGGPGAETPEPGAAEAGSAGREGGAGDAVERDIAALLEEAERKRDEYLELARRTQADFENFRKRMAAEVEAAGARGRATVIGDVVGVLDDLERALGAAGLDPEGDSEDALAHGVLLVFRGLREALSRHGVEPVDPAGEKFDPTAHEALSTMAVEGAEAGTVVEVMQKGYRVGEQLLRPARVVVAE